MKERWILTPQSPHPQPEQSPLQLAQFEQEQGAIFSDDDDDKADADGVVISVCFVFALK